MGNRYTKNPRKTAIVGRATPEEYAACQAAAKERRVTVAELVRLGLVAIGALPADVLGRK